MSTATAPLMTAEEFIRDYGLIEGMQLAAAAISNGAIPPKLIIETRPPNVRLSVLMTKAREYLELDVEVIIIVDPVSQSLGVFSQNELPYRCFMGDIVTLPDVIPGFEVPVKAFFE